MTRIAVLVSGGGTNLQALIGARDRGARGGGKLAAAIAAKAAAYDQERGQHAGNTAYM